MTASGALPSATFRCYSIQYRCVEMSGSRLISAFGLAVIFSQIFAIISADIVPVVILGGRTPESTQSVDALRIMSKNEFREVVGNRVGGSQPSMVVFSKENFCVEDLSQEKLQIDNLHSSYFPSVDSPLNVLENLESYNISKDEKPETISGGQLIIVPVENLATVSELYTLLREISPKLIGFITGTSCSYSRSERTRRAITTRDENSVIAYAERILLYSGNGIWLRAAGASNFTLLGQPTNVSSSANSSSSVRLDLNFAPNNYPEVSLRLQFTGTSSKYWYFESIEYESNGTLLILTSRNTIFFPYHFSYHCTKDSIFYHNDSTALNFALLQVQVDPKINASSSLPLFSDGYDCIGFTTIPILSGIFVTAILALIMIWAVTMIMDIRTMDRFDDPKGKTITIAVSE